jgi:hypothetical protein
MMYPEVDLQDREHIIKQLHEGAIQNTWTHDAGNLVAVPQKDTHEPEMATVIRTSNLEVCRPVLHNTLQHWACLRKGSRWCLAPTGERPARHTTHLVRSTKFHAGNRRITKLEGVGVSCEIKSGSAQTRQQSSQYLVRLDSKWYIVCTAIFVTGLGKCDGYVMSVNNKMVRGDSELTAIYNHRKEGLRISTIHSVFSSANGKTRSRTRTKGTKAILREVAISQSEYERGVKD